MRRTRPALSGARRDRRTCAQEDDNHGRARVCQRRPRRARLRLERDASGCELQAQRLTADEAVEHVLAPGHFRPDQLAKLRARRKSRPRAPVGCRKRSRASSEAGFPEPRAAIVEATERRCERSRHHQHGQRRRQREHQRPPHPPLLAPRGEADDVLPVGTVRRRRQQPRQLVADQRFGHRSPCHLQLFAQRAVGGCSGRRDSADLGHPAGRRNRAIVKVGVVARRPPSAAAPQRSHPAAHNRAIADDPVPRRHVVDVGDRFESPRPHLPGRVQDGAPRPRLERRLAAKSVPAAQKRRETFLDRVMPRLDIASNSRRHTRVKRAYRRWYRSSRSRISALTHSIPNGAFCLPR